MNDLQEKILQFYKEQGRDLPWRKTTDRYKILVSEFMLQQTQVSRVIEKYLAWTKRFPTLKDLREASLSEVLSYWSGLGYNSRAKRLHDIAKQVKEIPENVEELLALPGIGPYTARSVLIFADNKDIATVDTNIRRILIYELKLDETISDKELFTIAQTLVPKGRSRDWHNALMDYGSSVLTARKTGIQAKSKQSAFKGSRRYYRAKILKEALQGPVQTEHTEIAKDMVAEGLLREENGRYLIND